MDILQLAPQREPDLVIYFPSASVIPAGPVEILVSAALPQQSGS